MSALLRSGKFLRLVSGVARNNANNNPVSASGTPGVAGGGGALPPPGVGAADGSGLIPPVDYIGSFQAWSLQHLENALPTIGGSSSQQQEKVPSIFNFYVACRTLL